ncbi:hypothetical protein CEXT_491491, partial [Caerostris extrusa]
NGQSPDTSRDLDSHSVITSHYVQFVRARHAFVIPFTRKALKIAPSASLVLNIHFENSVRKRQQNKSLKN